MKIYLAARYSRRRELCKHRDLLELLGHEITSRWLDGKHELLNREGLSIEAEAPARQRFALEDWQDLMSADVVISFTEPPRSHRGRGGRHVEFGAALASGKHCIVIGPAENVFHCHADVERFEQWTDFLDAHFPIEPGKAVE